MQKSAHSTTRNTKQGGFTLIELMIVVAIIGVLASIAVPQYQNYVGRAQVSEAISLASSAKTAVSEYYLTNGSWPTDTDDAGIETMEGSYVASTGLTGTGGLIQVTMKGTGDVATGLEGTSLIFEPSDAGGTIQWECRSATGAGDEIPTRFLPASCR